MTWDILFDELKQKPYWKELEMFWDEEYSNHVVYPKRENIFNAFKLAKLDELKVVIMGQDPYHEPGQAMGLSFSVPDGISLPPSLKNIYKEIEIEYDCKMNYSSGDLTYLANQGVLMLNSILTVREHEPMSHNNKLYKNLLKDILEYIDNLDQPIVFLLWGNPAKKLDKYLTNEKHHIIYATHPSPLGANKGGWFNSGVFTKTNDFFSKNALKNINWIK